MTTATHGSSWTHPICEECYKTMYPDRVPVRMRYPEPTACCNCRKLTIAGIYYREDPSKLPYCPHRTE